MVQSGRSVLIRIVLYSVTLLTLIITTRSFWAPFVLAPEDEEPRVNRAELFLQNPDRGDSVDLGWTIENTPSSDNEYATGITLNIEITAALHTGNLSRDFYIAIYGSSEFNEYGADYCSIKSQHELISASVERMESEVFEQSVAAKYLPINGLHFRGTLNWSAEKDRTTDNPVTPPQARIECPLSATPWAYDNPDYHLRSPELRIVAPHNGTERISSSTFCLDSHYRQMPNQTISAAYPAATGGWGQYLSWKECGSSGAVTAPDPYRAYRSGDSSFEELGSDPVSLTVHDLEQAGQQVKVLFFAGAIAGILAAIAVEILNVLVGALAGITFGKRPETDPPPDGPAATAPQPSPAEPDVLDQPDDDGESEERTAGHKQPVVQVGALLVAVAIGLAAGRALGRRGDRRTSGRGTHAPR